MRPSAIVQPLSFLFAVSLVGCGGGDGEGGPDAGCLCDAPHFDAPEGFLANPEYREGFGRNATGGAGGRTYEVTSSAESGPGSFADAFADGNSDVTVIFAVETVTLPNTQYLGSNVTIDGMANGQDGVTVDMTADTDRGLVVEDPAENIVIRGLNLRSTGTPDSGVTEFDLLALDGTNGASISNVFIDRCTFVQGSDGALDITGDVSDVTVQRSLFYGTSKTMLIKYGSRANLSIHHNVFTRNGERNPQVKGDMQLIDFVNNVVHLNDVPTYPDGSSVDAYGPRIWSADGASDSPGDVVGNFVASAFLGDGAQVDLVEDPGASLAGVYLDEAGNLYDPASNGATSPRATPNAVPAEFQVTWLPVSELEAALLPVVGAPNRTALDQEHVDAVADALP